jgi:hypothetical protein
MPTPRVGYTCGWCDFSTNTTNCDTCHGVVVWDSDRKQTAHCTGCGRAITDITCRKCGGKVPL